MTALSLILQVQSIEQLFVAQHAQDLVVVVIHRWVDQEENNEAEWWAWKIIKKTVHWPVADLCIWEQM